MGHGAWGLGHGAQKVCTLSEVEGHSYFFLPSFLTSSFSDKMYS